MTAQEKYPTPGVIPAREAARKPLLALLLVHATTFTLLLGLLATLLLTLMIPLTGASFAVELQRFSSLAEQRFGPSAGLLAEEWRSLIHKGNTLPIASQLRMSNDFFNERIAWQTDEQVYGLEDYWATPLETIGHKAADCEDFSIAKYVTLLLLGVPKDALRLVYVKATLPGGAAQAHMVLAWYETPGAVPLILDNINHAVLPATARADLKPVFSFNTDTLWVGGSPQTGRSNPQARISRWQKVLERMAQDGFDGLW